MPVLTKDQVLQAVYELDADDRSEVLALLNGEANSSPLTPEQEHELDEALCEHEANPNAARPWSEVIRQLRAKR
jgi:hypothetical protein